MMEAAVACEAEQTAFDENLAAFKAFAPHLYSRLAAIKSPNTQLGLAEDGGLDLLFRGQGLYGRDAAAYTQAQIDTFFAAPTREWINEPNPEGLEGQTGDYCQRLADGMKAARIAYDPARKSEDSHFLIVFGIGLGLHVEALIEAIKPQTVILLEPNLEFLHQSLHITPWNRILDLCSAENIACSLLVDRDPLKLATQARRLMQANNPALLDGVYFYTHYPSSILSRAQEIIRHDLFLAISGLGFFEDELIMARNAMGNLARGDVAILSDFLPDREEPLFVVGSGPSIDKELDGLAGRGDKAVLMSVGTGLRGLLERGIRPDYHVELENGETNRDNLQTTAAEFGLGGITLVGSLTVHPGTAALFDDIILFFRERVSSTMLFGAPYQMLLPAGPTVANAGLISSIRLGFREIYLFGVDMGTKESGRFHAKGSIYGAGLREDVSKPSRSFAGNFGGEATGLSLLNWSRHVLENVARFYRGVVRVYNCSDGARIEGAVPKVSRAIALPGEAIDKDRVRQEIAAGLTRCNLAIARRLWDEQEQVAATARTWERIGIVLDQAAAMPDPDLSWVHRLYRIVKDEQETNPFMASFVFGTVTVALGCACWYDRRIVEDDDRRAFRRMAIAEFRTLVANMRGMLDELLDEITVQLPAA